MTVRVAINGFGRIGRSVLRALYENGYRHDLQVVAINELADTASMAYMLRYDSTHGRFPGTVELVDEDTLLVNEDRISIYHSQTIEQLDWCQSGVDLVLECSGQLRSRQQAEQHLQAGARRVLISNPADNVVDQTIIYGINHQQINDQDQIISNGSCSTNALIPILYCLDRALGIEAGVTTTIHSAMNDQPVIDAYHSDLRRTRAAGQSIIPVDTGLPAGIERLMPNLAGRIESLHIRVPTNNVSALDISLQVQGETSPQAVNDLLQSASENEFNGLLGTTYDAHASIDFNHDPHSAVVDTTQTRVSGFRLVKLLVWFDNEWGFANRMLDSARHWTTEVK